MKRIFITITIIAGTLQGAFPCHAGFIARELLGRPTTNSVTINACADSAITAYYQYGTDSANYESQTEAVACQDSIPFVCTITGLQPNTQYYYRMRYRPEGTDSYLTGENHSFRTARTDHVPFTFAIDADPHMDTACNANVFTKTMENIREANPDFLIDLGDNFFTEKYPPYSSARTLQRHLLLRSFYDIACSSVPLYLVLGNHEGEQGWRLDGTPNSLPVMATNTRKAYFPNPEPNDFYSGDTTNFPFVGRRGDYYSWEWGNALFVVLDPYWNTSQAPQRDYWRYTLGRTQYEWFARVLRESHANFKFVFIHQLVGGNATEPRGGIESAPFFEMGGKNLDSTWGFDVQRAGWGTPLHQLMVENGVSALFHGHDHFYDKQDLDGIVYQLVPQPSVNNYQRANSAQAYGYVNGTILPPRGFLKVTVADTVCRVEYVRTYLPAEENGQRHNGDIGDSYTIVRADSGEAVIAKEGTLPRQSSLMPNYPNPFNSETAISFEIASKSEIRLEVFNPLGQLVQTLINQPLGAGSYTVHYRPTNLSAGTYYYRLLAGGVSKTSKMVFLK